VTRKIGSAFVEDDRDDGQRGVGDAEQDDIVIEKIDSDHDVLRGWMRTDVHLVVE
jgi:hypothetical protein